MTDALQVDADEKISSMPPPGLEWAFAVVMNGDRHIHDAAEALVGASNNTFELLSVVKAIFWLEKRNGRKHLRSSGPYPSPMSLKDAAGGGSSGAAMGGNGCRANSYERRRPIPDMKCWQELDALLERNPHVRIQLCKGHSGIPGNELADLCQGCSDDCAPLVLR